MTNNRAELIPDNRSSRQRSQADCKMEIMVLFGENKYILDSLQYVNLFFFSFFANKDAQYLFILFAQLI